MNVRELTPVFAVFFAMMVFSTVVAFHAKAFLKNLINVCMLQPEANSRLVFLLSGVVTSAATFLLTLGFLFAHDRSGFPTMIAAVGGGGLGAAIGRYATKVGDGKQNDPKQSGS